MRILFAASPAIAVPCLELLLCADPDWELVGLLTNPPASRGRHGTPLPSDVAAALLAHTGGPGDRAASVRPGHDDGVSPAVLPPVLSPEKLDAAAREAVAALKPDLLVSFAFGKIFGPRFMALFPLGGINVHPSLLPRWRGATPIPAAILAGDRETGITLQTIAPKMDAGDILEQSRFPLEGTETTAGLSARVAAEAPALLETVLRRYARGEGSGRPQDEAAVTVCPLLSKEDGLIDWSRPAREIGALVRACDPWPLAHTHWEGQGLSILAVEPAPPATQVAAAPPAGSPAPADSAPAAPGTVLGVDKRRGILVQTGDGVLYVRRLQLAARKALDWQSFINGTRGFVGSQLG